MSLLTCGIDLGTTSSSIAICKEEKVELIQNDLKHKTTPSYVSFEDEEIVVGSLAKNRASKNMKNTVYDAKRMIGHKFCEEGVQEDMKHWGFKVEEDKNDGGCLIKVKYKEEEYKAKPQEISSYVLNYLSECLRNKVGEKDKTIHAVITVPAYFDNDQRRATIEAGELAGLNVLQIINEPTAAALAYGSQFFKDNKDRKILIYDFGGGTFDVSIIEVKKTKITVRATGGDDHLGGEDINSNLVSHYLKKLKDESGSGVVSSKELFQLRKACDDAKINLSVSKSVELDSELLDDNEIDCELSQADFNRINNEIFEKTIRIVEKVLNESGLSKNEIDNVVLVGGSSRIPKVQELLSKFFNGKVLNKDINPDEAVSYGASILAEDILLGVREEKDKDGKIQLIDNKTNEILNADDKMYKYVEADKVKSNGRKVLVPNSGKGRKVLVTNGYKEPIRPSAGRKIPINEILTHSIGTGSYSGRFINVLPKNSKIPYKNTKGYSSVKDYEDHFSITFYQGEDPIASKNKKIGKHRITVLKPRPAGESKDDVTMKINENGILDVKVTPVIKGDFEEQSLKIEMDRSTL